MPCVHMQVTAPPTNPASGIVFPIISGLAHHMISHRYVQIYAGLMAT